MTYVAKPQRQRVRHRRSIRGSILYLCINQKNTFIRVKFELSLFLSLTIRRRKSSAFQMARNGIQKVKAGLFFLGRYGVYIS